MGQIHKGDIYRKENIETSDESETEKQFDILDETCYSDIVKIMFVLELLINV